LKFSRAEQLIGLDTHKYHAETVSTAEYATLPQPYTTYGIGLPQGVLDTGFPTDLPNGPLSDQQVRALRRLHGRPGPPLPPDVAGCRCRQIGQVRLGRTDHRHRIEWRPASCGRIQSQRGRDLHGVLQYEPLHGRRRDAISDNYHQASRPTLAAPSLPSEQFLRPIPATRGFQPVVGQGEDELPRASVSTAWPTTAPMPNCLSYRGRML
jgi:hypothetical protein